jgi:hypothetical protein
VLSLVMGATAASKQFGLDTRARERLLAIVRDGLRAPSR